LKWAFEGRFTNPNVKEGELPEGWVWSNVHEASISMKNGIYRSSDIYSNDGVACLRMYNIEDGKVIWFDIKRMKLTKQEIEQYQLSEGDLLVNRVNSRDLVGKTAYINKYDEPIVYESKNIRLRLKKDISGQYMNYWFLLSANKYFTSNAQQTVGMASINQKQLGDFKFPLPPTLSEQNLIVQEIEKRLSVADKLEESIATAIQQAEALRQSILKKAFEGKLLSEAELEECRNDPNWEPASVLLERIASAKLSIKRAERHNKTSQDKNKPAKNRVKS
ncbi:MAG: type I restriction endonuclease subunit S, partial [Flexilinea flocculi]|nr:type I restriction endonuclease subunit S [Flexilinea flocculi]